MPEMIVVIDNRLNECWGTVVWHIIFLTGLFNDDSELRIVNVTHILEEMMYNLIIESSHIPRGKLAGRCKIRCRPKLMSHPLMLHDAITFWLREFEPIRDMCEREYQRNSESEDEVCA